MAIFSSLVFNNGTAHTFIERGQIPNSKAIVREYIEPAAAAAAQSKMTIKQDLASTTVKRALLQRKVMVAGSDGVLYPITVNFTATFNPKHAVADVVLEQKLLVAAAQDPSFYVGFAQGLS